MGQDVRSKEGFDLLLEAGSNTYLHTYIHA